jgi:hypothetical protein
MWSASMLVTTDTTGDRNRKDASDSSASATRKSPAPSRALAPAEFSLPPMTKVGSSLPSARQLAISEVVVVLPCVPATAMPCLMRISSASICARAARWECAFRARSTTSGLSADRCGGDHGVGAGDVLRLVTLHDACAEAGQTTGHRVVGEIRATHGITLVQQHFGDAAHAGTADTDEVDVADLVFHLIFSVSANEAQMSATSALAPGRARARARCAMSCSAGRSRERISVASDAAFSSC